MGLLQFLSECRHQLESILICFLFFSRSFMERGFIDVGNDLGAGDGDVNDLIVTPGRPQLKQKWPAGFQALRPGLIGRVFPKILQPTKKLITIEPR